MTFFFFWKYRFHSAVHASMGVNEDIDIGTIMSFYPRAIKDQIMVFLQCRMREKLE